MSVSYTHLDVYKRQVHGGTIIAEVPETRAIVHKCMVPPNVDGVVAVSYTHLDVYKRQSEFCCSRQKSGSAYDSRRIDRMAESDRSGRG